MDSRMDRKIIAAVEYLHTLMPGDKVQVGADGRTYNMYVSRDAHRSDGPYGSYESTRVTVWFGPGRYARDVTAEQIAYGLVEIDKGHSDA